MTRRARLKNVAIKSIHLVDNGDNPEARFVMLKSAPEPELTDEEIQILIEQEAALSAPQTQLQAYELIQKIAQENGISYSQALQSAAGQRIYANAQNLSADVLEEDVEKSEPEETPPTYLQEAAERIALRKGISTERAFAYIPREEPTLAKRYRSTS